MFFEGKKGKTPSGLLGLCIVIFFLSFSMSCGQISHFLGANESKSNRQGASDAQDSADALADDSSDSEKNSATAVGSAKGGDAKDDDDKDDDDREKERYGFKSENLTFSECTKHYVGYRPKLIRTQQDLQSMKGGYYQLANDITLQGQFKPISGSQVIRLDGNGYVVRNLKIIQPYKDNIAMFSNFKGCIENMTLENVVIEGRSQVAAYIANGYDVEVVNTRVSGTIQGSQMVGALIGVMHMSDLKLSGVDADISINALGSRVGGLIGKLHANSRILLLDELHVRGEIKGRDEVGGIIGYVESHGENIFSLSHSSSRVKVQGQYRLGGMIGSLLHVSSYFYPTTPREEPIIYSSYSQNKIKGQSEMGGVIGFLRLMHSYMYQATIYDTHVTTSIQGQDKGGGFVGLGILTGRKLDVKSSSVDANIQTRVTRQHSEWIGHMLLDMD